VDMATLIWMIMRDNLEVQNTLILMRVMVD